MAGQSPNSANIERVARGAAAADFIITHPEYQYYRPDWVKIRDAISGQREIKRKGTTYLRKLSGATAGDYEEYLDGAIFFNMTAQTLAGMTGQVFRRNPTVKNLEPKLRDGLVSFGKDSSTHVAFTKTIVTEQCSMGRYGVLVDAPSAPAKDGTANSYVVGYKAEDILDWTVEDIYGQNVLTRVLLREWVRASAEEIAAATNANKRSRRPTADGAKAWPYQYKCRYRELLLEPNDESEYGYGYIQKVYDERGPQGDPDVIFEPLIRGNPIPYIPFVFFGATSNSPDCEKPPLLDIADLNISHYRTYADLEHGRQYTALPIYVAPGGAGPGASGTGVSEYNIGPNTVWEVPNGSEPTILEYKGEGLKTLERALSTKENQIAAIGGRLLPGMGQGVSESESQSALREASEQSILLNVLLAAQDGMSLVVRYWAAYRDMPFASSATVRYVLNTGFLWGGLDARVLRAVQLMWESGLFPVEVLYENLMNLEALGEDWTLEAFIAAMNDPKAFTNNPDAQARQRGYDSRKQELDEAARAKEIGMQEQEIDLQRVQLGIAENEDEREDEQHDLDIASGKVDLQAKRQIVAAGAAGAPPAAAGAGSGFKGGLSGLPTVQKPALTPHGATGQTPKPGGPVNTNVKTK